MTVVVAFTPDEFGRAALTYGATEASFRGEKLIVVNATRGDAYVDTHFAHGDEVDALRARLAQLEVDAEVRQAVASDVADAVLQAVTEVNASLLVVGIRHRTPVGKLLLGSTAQRLILDASCPVLAVKPHDGADDGL